MGSNLVVAKFKESAVSVLPVMALVALLHLTAAPLGPSLLARFFLGGGLLIAGLGVFLTGADLAMVPFGQKVGSALTNLRRLPLMLAAAAAIGFAVTVAEPDVQVLVKQVAGVAPSVGPAALLTSIAAGVGLFTAAGLARAVFRLSLRPILCLSYGLLFAMCALGGPGTLGMAFDAGGATTGPVTVPFIMAMGLGVSATAKKQEGDDNGFGLVGLASRAGWPAIS